MHFDFQAYAGTPFFRECLHIYNTTFTNIIRVLLLGYVFLTIYYLIKGNCKERFFFVLAPVVLVIVALNPWAAWQYVDKLSMGTRYFRIFWLLPLVFAYVYFFVNVILKKFGKKKKMIVGLFLAAGVIVAAKTVVDTTEILYTGVNPKEKLTVVDNRYKVQDDVLIAADLIEEVAADPEKEKHVLYDYFTYIEIRTYNASIIPVLQGNDIHAWSGVGISQENIDAAVAESDWMGLVNMMFSGAIADPRGYIELDTQILQKALLETNTEYIILPNGNAAYSKWLEVGTVIGYTPNYTVLRVNEMTQQDTEAYKEALYVPTFVTKIEDTYFIMDCWQHRLLYSESLSTPIAEWQTMTEEITGGHTVAFNGSLYVTEDTEGGRILVFRRDGDGFEKIQVIEGITGRPHYTIYDNTWDRFLTISAEGGCIYVFREQDDQLELESSCQFEELTGAYIRSMNVIDEYLYLTCGPGYITKVEYLDGQLQIVDRYDVTPELYNMNYITKINDFYYCTVNITGEDAHSDIVRTKDLESLAEGQYESIYQDMGFAGTPYFISNFDGKYYITEVGENGNNGIRSFEVTADDQIQNVEILFFYPDVSESSRMRKAERM